MRNDRVKREKGVPAVNEVTGRSGALRCPSRTHPCLPWACGQGRSTWSCPRFICGCAPRSSFLASRLSPAAPPAVRRCLSSTSGSRYCCWEGHPWGSVPSFPVCCGDAAGRVAVSSPHHCLCGCSTSREGAHCHGWDVLVLWHCAKSLLS